MAKREDGIFTREDFTYDKVRDVYTCPAAKLLTTTGRIREDDLRLYRASKLDCDICSLKMQCCPKALYSTPHQKAKDSNGFTGSFGDSSWARKAII
jgi:hypothetical protein